MGQQQLLLVILVTIIIGVATIVTINVLNSQSVEANRNAVRQDMTAAASFVQSLWERPNLFGGANRQFTTLEEEKILEYLNVPSSNYQAGDTEATNDNGTYRVVIVNDSELRIIGEPSTGPPNFQLTILRNNDTGNWEFQFSDVSDDN